MRKALLVSVGLALGLSIVCLGAKPSADSQVTIQPVQEPAGKTADWPVLTRYDEQHLAKIALPLGGIGTGTVSLGGRGDLRDWEIMNRPAKGFTPKGTFGPFFAVFVKDLRGQTQARGLEGPIDLSLYEDASGSSAMNHGLPRFRKCTFAAAYPLGQVILSDLDMPVDVTLQAFNPLVPCDPETSGIPVAVLRYVVRNKTNQPLEVSVCGNVPNFIGNDSSGQTKDHKGDLVAAGGKANRNEYRQGKAVNGIFMSSEGVAQRAPQWGTIALTTTATTGITHRISWLPGGWGSSGLDFWDDFSKDGRLDERERAKKDDAPMASLAVTLEVPPKRSVPVTFLVTWHFPNRITWTPKNNDQDRIGNYYTTVYKDAWDVAERVAPQIDDLENEDRRIRRGVLQRQSARGGEGGRPFQCQHAAHPDLFPHRRWTVLRLRRLQQPRRLLSRLVHARLELRAGDRVSLRRLGQDDARDRVRTGHGRSGTDELPRESAAGAIPRVPQGGRRWADGLHHEDVPRLAAFRR